MSDSESPPISPSDKVSSSLREGQLSAEKVAELDGWDEADTPIDERVAFLERVLEAIGGCVREGDGWTLDRGEDECESAAFFEVGKTTGTILVKVTMVAFDTESEETADVSPTDGSDEEESGKFLAVSVALDALVSVLRNSNDVERLADCDLATLRATAVGIGFSAALESMKKRVREQAIGDSSLIDPKNLCLLPEIDIPPDYRDQIVDPSTVLPAMPDVPFHQERKLLLGQQATEAGWSVGEGRSAVSCAIVREPEDKTMTEIVQLSRDMSEAALNNLLSALKLQKVRVLDVMKDAEADMGFVADEDRLWLENASMVRLFLDNGFIASGLLNFPHRLMRHILVDDEAKELRGGLLLSAPHESFVLVSPALSYEYKDITNKVELAADENKKEFGRLTTRRIQMNVLACTWLTQYWSDTARRAHSGELYYYLPPPAGVHPMPLRTVVADVGRSPDALQHHEIGIAELVRSTIKHHGAFRDCI